MNGKSTTRDKKILISSLVIASAVWALMNTAWLYFYRGSFLKETWGGWFFGSMVAVVVIFFCGKVYLNRKDGKEDTANNIMTDAFLMFGFIYWLIYIAFAIGSGLIFNFANTMREILMFGLIIFSFNVAAIYVGVKRPKKKEKIKEQSWSEWFDEIVEESHERSEEDSSKSDLNERECEKTEEQRKKEEFERNYRQKRGIFFGVVSMVGIVFAILAPCPLPIMNNVKLLAVITGMVLFCNSIFMILGLDLFSKNKEGR